MIKAIISDLDNTIFLTRSISSKIIDPFFFALKSTNDVLTSEDLALAGSELWERPFFTVAKKYGFSQSMINAGLEVLSGITADLEIEPFRDYHYLKALRIDKYLVTSGITNVQWNKIKSLNIENDFLEIFIDDPFVTAGGKLALFKSLMHKYHYAPNDLLVVGDNPESEILAGKTLGMPTVLVDRNLEYKQGLADYQLNTLKGLSDILN